MVRWRSFTLCNCSKTSVAACLVVALLHIASVQAHYNVTVSASDPVLQYQPPEAWETITNQALGDGTARVTRTKDAKVSFSFNGTGVYFQTTRAQSRGIGTVDLDGEKFSVDSSFRNAEGDLGVLWGVLSLKDEQHTITVIQSAEDGVEIAVNTFVYLTSTPPPPTLQRPELPEPSLLDPANPNISRNIALVTTGLVLLTAFVVLIGCIIKRRRRTAAIDKASIRLAMSPASPLWIYKSFGSSAATTRTDTSSILKTPSSAVFLMQHSRQEGEKSIESILNPVRQIPQAVLVRNTSLALSTPRRPQFVLPHLMIDHRFSQAASAVTPADAESSSPTIPVTSASSDLEHDGHTSAMPDIPTDVSTPSPCTSPRSPFVVEEANDQLAFRLQARSPNSLNSF